METVKVFAVEENGTLHLKFQFLWEGAYMYDYMYAEVSVYNMENEEKAFTCTKFSPKGIFFESGDLWNLPENEHFGKDPHKFIAAAWQQHINKLKSDIKDFNYLREKEQKDILIRGHSLEYLRNKYCKQYMLYQVPPFLINLDAVCESNGYGSFLMKDGMGKPMSFINQELLEKQLK